MDSYYEIVPFFKDKPELHEGVNVMLTSLIRRQWGYFGSNKGEFSHVYFTWRELRSLLGVRYREVLDLLNHKYFVIEKIDMQSKYNKQLHCYLMVLMPQAFKKKRVRYKRIKNAINKTMKRLSDYPKQYHSAIQGLRHMRLSISFEEYEREVAIHYSHYIENTKTPLSFDDYMKQMMFVYKNIKDFEKCYGRAIYNFITVDEFGHRLHTPYTSLPSFLRKYITTIKGEHLESIDLKQSQPSFLNELLYSINPNNSLSKDFLSSDDIYHSIMEKVSLTSRKEAKKLFFKMVFGYPKGKHFNLFKQHYPDVADIIHSINSQVNPDNPSTKRHSNLAMMLQRYESSVFVKVWNKLTENGIRYITIHDEVMVEARHHSKAVRIIYDELSKHLVNPELVIDKV